MPVNTRDARNVFRRLEAALDFEGGDAGARQLPQHVEAGEVLRREEVVAPAQLDFVAVGDEFVGHPAGLRALAAIGAASAERLAGEALAGVSHAERAVDENLDRQWGMGNGEWGIGGRDGSGARLRNSQFAIHNFSDLLDGTLPRQHHEVAAQLAGEGHARRAGDGHLRAGVDGEVRREPADEPGDAHVLHDGGVHPGGDDAAEISFGVGQLVGEDKGVESDVAFHAAPVEKLHEPGQVGFREVVRAHPSVEAVETEVDRVRTVLDCGLGTFPIASGSEKLGQHSSRAGGDGRLRGGAGNWLGCGGHWKIADVDTLRRGNRSVELRCAPSGGTQELPAVFTGCSEACQPGAGC